MKKITWSVLLVFIFLACKKDPAPSSKILAGSQITSYTRHDALGHKLQIDSLTYDRGGMVANYQSWTYDSTANPILTDYENYSFSFPAGSTLPNAYRYSITSSQTSSTAESHLLYYDGQGRIIKDSLNLPLNNLTRYYSYINNFITIESKQYGTSFSEKDTFVVSAGNVSDYNYYYFEPAIIASFLVNAKYTDFANPFYNKILASSLGAFFLEEIRGDFISVNMPKSLKSIDNTQNSNGQDTAYIVNSNFTWIADSNGNIVSGSDSTNGNYYNFIYK